MDMKKLKKDTAKKKKYLAYKKKAGRNALKYGEWSRKQKRASESKKMGGSPQTQRQLQGLSGSDYAEIMNKFGKKR